MHLHAHNEAHKFRGSKVVALTERQPDRQMDRQKRTNRQKDRKKDPTKIITYLQPGIEMM